MFVLLISASGASAAGPTYVYQNISTDTTWNEAGSPYIVNQTIYVQQGVRLTVGPNVAVRADPTVTINVNGSLIANGEAARMVDFTQNSTMWSGIVANNRSVVNFNYVNFDHALSDGVLVQNNEEFHGPTGIQHGDFPGEVAQGPIVLQGDHAPVQFRNVWVVPL